MPPPHWAIPKRNANGGGPNCRRSARRGSILEAALKYFREAAPKHSADEEEDLFPSLRENASSGVLAVLEDVDRLEAEHATADARHREADVISQLWLRQNQLSPKDAARLRDVLESLANLYPLE